MTTNLETVRRQVNIAVDRKPELDRYRQVDHVLYLIVLGTDHSDVSKRAASRRQQARQA